jgi:hypothetical protein
MMEFEDFCCVMKAWRLARWANHAWGLLGGVQISKVWDICPSLSEFCRILPGYALASGWITKGPAGYGVTGPQFDDDAIVVHIGSHRQVVARFKPGETTVQYRHDHRFARARLDGPFLDWDYYMPEPRYWARVARILIVAENPYPEQSQTIRELLRGMVGDDPVAQSEFDRYFALTGPEILARQD